MLVDARKREIVLFKQGKNFVQLVGGDAKFGVLARSDDLGMVARANAGVKTHHDLAALVDAAKGIELRERINADKQAARNGVFELGFGIVVGNVQNFSRGKTGQFVHVQFAGAHGVHHQAFLAHNAQQGRGGVGLYGIVHAETGVFGKAHKIAATLPQHVFVINI